MKKENLTLPQRWICISVSNTLFNGEVSPSLEIVCFWERKPKLVQIFNKFEMEKVGNTERNSTPLSVIPLISAKTTKCEWCITSHLSHLKLEQLYPPSFSNFMTSNEKVNIVGSYHLRNKKNFSKIITEHSSLSYHHYFLGQTPTLKAVKPNRSICTKSILQNEKLHC